MTFSRGGGPDEQQAEAVHHQQGGRDGRQAEGVRHFQEDGQRPTSSPQTDVVFPWDRSQQRDERERQLQRAETIRRLLDERQAGEFFSQKKNKPTHFTINLGCALGKVQRVGTGLTQTVLPQAPMRGLSALNGDPKEVGHFQSQARAPDEFLH